MDKNEGLQKVEKAIELEKQAGLKNTTPKEPPKCLCGVGESNLDVDRSYCPTHKEAYSAAIPCPDGIEGCAVLHTNLPTNNSIEDELNKIVSEICCTPNLCWPTKLCGYCIEDVQKLTQLIAKQVKEARIDELEQMPSHTDINLHVRDRLAQLRSDCPTCPLINGYHHFDCPTLRKENRESGLKSSTAEGENQ